MKDKTWKGLKEHTAAGWNLGKVPYGYLPERVTDPNPSRPLGAWQDPARLDVGSQAGLPTYTAVARKP